MRMRARLLVWLFLLVAAMVTLSACSSRCVACQGLRDGPTPEVAAFTMCASEAPETERDDSTCLGVEITYVVVD